MLDFDAPTHTYHWNGQIVPSVTQLLSDFQDFSHVSPAVMEAAQLRGTNVHLLCQFVDEDCLDESQFTAEELSYLPAWRAFLRDARPNWSAIERPFYSRRHGYAGTPDRAGVLEGIGGARGVFDIKTPASESPLWALQTAGYGDLVSEWEPDLIRRFTIQLRPDGTYRLREWDKPGDWPVFLSLVTLNRWTRKNL